MLLKLPRIIMMIYRYIVQGSPSLPAPKGTIRQRYIQSTKDVNVFGVYNKIINRPARYTRDSCVRLYSCLRRLQNKKLDLLTAPACRPPSQREMHLSIIGGKIPLCLVLPLLGFHVGRNDRVVYHMWPVYRIHRRHPIHRVSHSTHTTLVHSILTSRQC